MAKEKQRDFTESDIVQIINDSVARVVQDSIDFQNYFTQVLDLIKTENPNKANLTMALNAQQEMFKIASKYRKYDDSFKLYSDKLAYVQTRLKGP